jgi:hypothetical protein
MSFSEGCMECLYNGSNDGGRGLDAESLFEGKDPTIDIPFL